MPYFPERCVIAGVLTSALVLVGCDAGNGGVAQPDPRLDSSRQAVATFAADLKQRLMGAMESGGAAAAVGVCAEAAPAIAARVSQQSGASVSRTALRYRNPDNAPLPWQESVMRNFAAGLEAGKDAASMEHFVTTPDGGARFMKPIMTARICLACHGEVQSGPLADAISAYYPADEATGFSAGELRGAFVVEWPAR